MVHSMAHIDYAMVPAEAEHIDDLLAWGIRQADIDECWAASRMTPEEAMREGMKVSSAWTGLLYGIPVCMFGVTPVSLLSGTGAPWMIGTNYINRHPKAFLVGSKVVIRGMLAQFEHLFNFVDARNKQAVKWLKWLGFTIYDPVPYGPFNRLFHPFEMRRL